MGCYTSHENNFATKITIGITCFNAEKTIKEAVRSALDQTYTNCEILIVDDASSDNSLQILHHLVHENPAIKILIHHENKGAAVARNTILEHATGEYIAFFDDDDISAPCRVEVQLAEIQKYLAMNPERERAPIACFCLLDHYVFRKSEGWVKINLRLAKGYGIALDFISCGENAAIPMLMPNWLDDETLKIPAGTGCGMFQRDGLQSVNGFDPIMRRCEDLELAVRLALADGTFIPISLPLIQYRKTQSSYKSRKKSMVYWDMLIKKHGDFIRKYRPIEAVRLWQKLIICWNCRAFIPLFYFTFLFLVQYPHYFFNHVYKYFIRLYEYFIKSKTVQDHLKR